LRGEQGFGRPLGVVDERIAVALEAVDDLVACALGLVRRIGAVPGQQRGQQAHVGRRAGGLDDAAAVVGEFQVRLGLPAGVGAALVADGHVHHGTCHVALAVVPDLEAAAVAVRRTHPVAVAAAAAAAMPAVGLGRARAAAAVAVGIRLVAAVGVVGGVGEVEHVRVGVRGVGQATVAGGRAEAERIRPGVLAVVGQAASGAGAIGALGVAAVAVGIKDAAGVGRIL